MTDASEVPAGKPGEGGPLQCALPENVLAQRRLAIAAVLSERTAARLSSDGVELDFAFSEAIARILLEFIVYERSCCPGFAYTLCFLPPHDAVTLRLQAPAAQVAPLQAFYADLL